MEYFKPIPGYENYQVSNLGRVKGKRVVFLKPNLNTKGYFKIRLYNRGIGKTISVHQLVAMAFLDHEPDGNTIIVDHINNIKTDNRVENLQLISNRENYVKDRRDNLPIGVYKNPHAKTYYSRIVIDGKDKYLGRFKTIDQCNSAYLKALNGNSLK